jgi:hypothetical protein
MGEFLQKITLKHTNAIVFHSFKIIFFKKEGK